MNRFKALFFASVMIVSTAFFTSALGTGDPAFSASAQTVTVTRKRKPGIARRTYRGGKYVVRRTWDGTKWVSKKVWVATKWTGKKTWKTGRKVVSRTKKIVY
ncbi:MAG: hypothetical protein ABI539_11295 [Acidobacteriota bacterium]